MGCAVTEKCTPRALLRLQRETQNTAVLHGHTAGTHRRQPPPGRGEQEQIQQGGHTAWEELGALTVSPSCLRPHTPRLGPGMYRSWASTQLLACQGSESMHERMSLQRPRKSCQQPRLPHRAALHCHSQLAPCTFPNTAGHSSLHPLHLLAPL